MLLEAKYNRRGNVGVVHDNVQACGVGKNSPAQAKLY